MEGMAGNQDQADVTLFMSVSTAVTIPQGWGQGKRKQEVKSNITDNESAKMTTSKGTIQGYNGVATVDKKHQVIVDAQAFSAGQEQQTLQPVLEKVKERYQRLNISEDIYATGARGVPLTQRKKPCGTLALARA